MAKRIKREVFAFYHKKDKTLVNFGMPVKDFRQFADMTEATKKNKRLEDILRQHKVVRCTLTYTIK